MRRSRLLPIPLSLARLGVWGVAILGLVALLALAVTASASARSGAAASTFRLTNQHGEITDLAGLRGRPVLLTFLYTHCPDTCPLYLSNIATALRNIQAAGGGAPAVVVVTVDPDRDTVERLQEYSNIWPADWLFLTGRYQELVPTWQSYGISVQKRPHQHSSVVFEGYSVSHTAKVVLIGPAGTVSGELVGAWAPAALTQKLSTAADRPPVVGALSPLAAVSELLQRCGELASSQPAIFPGLLGLLALPGVVLPVYLLLALLRVRRADAIR